MFLLLLPFSAPLYNLDDLIEALDAGLLMPITIHFFLKYLAENPCTSMVEEREKSCNAAETVEAVEAGA